MFLHTKNYIKIVDKVAKQRWDACNVDSDKDKVKLQGESSFLPPPNFPELANPKFPYARLHVVCLVLNTLASSILLLILNQAVEDSAWALVPKL